MKNERKIKIVLIVIFGIFLVIALAVIILNNVIENKIKKELAHISPAFQVSYSSVNANLFALSVSFDSLEINYIPYSSRPQNRHSLQFSHTALKGISFYKFLFSKKLAAGNLLFEDGKIRLDKFLIDHKDSAQDEILSNARIPFQNLSINHIDLKRFAVFSYSNQVNQLLAKGDLALGQFQLNIHDSVLHFATIDFNLSDINYGLPGSDDSLHIQKMVMNSKNETVEIDSLQVDSTPKTTIPSILITGFDLKKLLNNHTIEIDKIRIDEGKIHIARNGEMIKTQSLPLNLNKIHIETFLVNNISVFYNGKIQEFNCRASVSLNNINIRSFDNDGVNIESTLCNLSGVHYSGNNYHDVEIRTIMLDSKKEVARISDLKIIPRFGQLEFGRKIGHQADRIEASIPQIEIIKPQVRELFHANLIADKIKISSSKAHVFRDRRLPLSQKYSPLPVAFLKTLPVNIRIKTCELSSSTIEYEEYPKSGFGQTGTLRIERASLILSPLINHPIASDPAYMVMKMNGSIMGSGTAEANIYMPLQNGRPYHMKGVFKNVDLTTLNSSSENLGKIRIKSGFLDLLFFDFTMTEEQSTGKIIGAYHHLIIQQLKKHTAKPDVASLASFMLRHAIIPLNKDESLPEKKRTGVVTYTRDPTRFVSYYFLQSLLIGIKASFNLGFLLPK